MTGRDTENSTWLTMCKDKIRGLSTQISEYFLPKSRVRESGLLSLKPHFEEVNQDETIEMRDQILEEASKAMGEQIHQTRPQEDLEDSSRPKRWIKR